jgi:hypothetical protein
LFLGFFYFFYILSKQAFPHSPSKQLHTGLDKNWAVLHMMTESLEKDHSSIEMQRTGSRTTASLNRHAFFSYREPCHAIPAPINAAMSS